MFLNKGSQEQLVSQGLRQLSMASTVLEFAVFTARNGLYADDRCTIHVQFVDSGREQLRFDRQLVLLHDTI